MSPSNNTSGIISFFDKGFSYSYRSAIFLFAVCFFMSSFVNAAAPTVTSNAATLVTSVSATFNGSANPNGEASYGYFRYSTTFPGTGNDTFGTRLPSSSSSDTDLGSGTASLAYSLLSTALLPGTTYYFCAVSRNPSGTSFGAVLSFTTPAAGPTANTFAATVITASSAILNGSSNPQGASTTGWFRIATTSPGTGNDTFGTRIPATGGTDLGGGVSTLAYSITAAGLSPGTTYYYCAICQNSQGTIFGAVISFTMPVVPTVSTLAATPVTATTATLNASVNPNGYASTGWFRYSLTDPGTGNDTFGTRLPASGGQSLGSGISLVASQQSLTMLTPATTYYYCAIAQNLGGTSVGAVMSFTTPAIPPTVATGASSSITATETILNGTVNANNRSTTVTFEYGLTTGYGTTVTAGQSPVTGSVNTNVSKAITGLSPNTTYHYRVIGQNSEGTTNGLDASFTTLKQSQTITFSGLSSRIYGDAVFTVSATASSGLDVIFTSSDETVATCSGTNGTTITILKAGTCNIIANQPGDANYSSAPQVTQTLTINKKTITVSAEAKTKTYGDPDPAFTYTYSPALSGSDSFTGSLTRIAGETVGSYAIVQGSLSLNANYDLTYVGNDLIITKATPVIIWTNPADIDNETALSSIQLNATSDAAGTFIYTPAAGTKLNVGNGQLLRADFEPTDAGNYESASKTVFINVFLATGIYEVATNGIVVYPNPVADAFSVAGIEGPVRISLSDLNGKILLTKEIYSGEKVFLTTLPDGIYIVKIETNSGAILKKVVKK